MELCSTFHLQTVMTNYDDPGMVQFHLGEAQFNPSRSKASALPPSLRYLHAILAHMITGRRESTGFVNNHDAFFLWCMSHGHVIDLAYFISLTIQHQTERHKKGVISIDLYADDPSSYPPSPSRPVYAAASYADISECLTRFEQ
ncbi:hypothetical protein GOBAR_AA26289 [Gossypium barbadense]|uniref:Uncharacterized protein n=1 Tax=Gossypium barbadense TaxID=3634 RepID=A0A2P5WTI3_GOSBA|nr:hypothetical protein GOBAR_AA26289 [Gossypium barbadense]